MGFLMVNCERATYLVSIEEERKLSPADRMRLKLHVLMCKFCRRFRRQVRFIAGRMKYASTEEGLSPAAGEKIIQMLITHK